MSMLRHTNVATWFCHKHEKTLHTILGYARCCNGPTFSLPRRELIVLKIEEATDLFVSAANVPSRIFALAQSSFAEHRA